MPSKLEQLSAMSIIVADTGDLDAIRALQPVDCTTNPSLVLKAARMPAYAHLVDEAVRWGLESRTTQADRIAAATRRLAVLFGREATQIVAGRVSTEVDARLSFDTDANVAEARALIAEYESLGIDRSRILIKIAATWEGIQAARQLREYGIDCNLTLVFCEAQAIAAADAGAFLISPFVGRVTDWYKARLKPGEAMGEDPGVGFVHKVYRRFKAEGRQTVVMAASFRSPQQVEALAGCDRLTVSPDILQQLASQEGDLVRALSPAALEANTPRSISEPGFRYALNQNAMATEKLAEGIRAFAADIMMLESLLAEVIGQG